MIEKVKCSTADFAAENVKKLLALFPEVEGDKGVVDLDKLRQVLSSKVVEGNVERYEFTWPGKRAAKAAAGQATTKTLRPCREESVGKDGTPGGFDSENLYIEGDNLEVLKLLQHNYAGKVKMIYIDPPYNTGHDFVYRDRFSLTDKELAEQGGSFDADGNRFEVNDSSEARYHSNWCSMMYPRLKLARQLLRDDGVMFMSIDDNEVENLRRIGDELFGEKNFVSQITIIVKTEGRQYGHFAKTHEFLLVYAKDLEKVSLNEILDPEAEFKYKDQTGGFNTIGLRNRAVRIFNSSNRPNLRYPFYVDASSVDGNGFMPVYTENKDASFVEVWPSVVDGLESVWRWGRETASKNLAELVATKGNDGEIRIFKKDRELTTLPKTMWQKKEFNSIYGTREVAELIGSGKFDFPKPLALISQIIEIGSDSDSLILDFFSGSSTTAHATMLRNVKDGGSRRFIMVQLPELTKDGHTICEVARERINSAGKRIAQENECQRMHQREELNFGEEISAVENPDIGFRVLKLDSSSLNETSDTPANTTQTFANFARFKEGRTSEDLLFQILLESGIPLSDSIEKKMIGGNEVFFVSGTALVACLDEKATMTNAFFTELAQLKPTLAFFRDDAFETDAARINLEQIFAQYSPSTTLKVI